MTLRESISLLYDRSADVRTASQEDFLARLRDIHIVFTHIGPSKIAQFWDWKLQSQFGLNAPECRIIYHRTAFRYGIMPCDYTLQKVSRRDIALGELHRQLWYEANAQFIYSRICLYRA